MSGLTGGSLVRFTLGTVAVTQACMTSRSWELAALGRSGTATITVPHGTPAASRTVLDPEGGTVVQIAGKGGCGDWLGVVTGLTFTTDGVVVSASQPGAMLGRRFVASRTVVGPASPGQIVYRALSDALGGSGAYPLSVDPNDFADGPPVVDRYLFDGQDAQSVVNDMQRLSGQELAISWDGVCSWNGPLAVSPLYGTLLAAPADLRGAEYATDPTTRVSEVIAVDSNGREYRATNADAAAASWPAQMSMSVETSSPNALYAAAEGELARTSEVMASIGGAVTQAHWAIREGDTVRCWIPWAGFDGETVAARVLSRSIDDGNPLMSVTFQPVIVPSVTAVASGIGGGVRQHAGRGGGRGSGSVVERLVAANRRVSELERTALRRTR